MRLIKRCIINTSFKTGLCYATTKRQVAIVLTQNQTPTKKKKGRRRRTTQSQKVGKCVEEEEVAEKK